MTPIDEVLDRTWIAHLLTFAPAIVASIVALALGRSTAARRRGNIVVGAINIAGAIALILAHYRDGAAWRLVPFLVPLGLGLANLIRGRAAKR
jgi:uncharacterized membrane protein